MRSWATEELKYAALPDKRLNKRLIKIVENLAGQPHASIPQASGAIRKHKSDLQFLAIVTNRSTSKTDKRKSLKMPNSEGF